jgi:endonuclease/exonuclease/phosphatase family metal-dependent hydrolase
MSLKIASWNIEGRLTNNDVSARSTPDKIIAEIRSLDADILILLEAHNNLNLNNLEARNKLEAMGYKLHSVTYNDKMPSRPDDFYKNLSLMILSKIPIEKPETIRLADYRNAIMATIKDPETNKKIRIIGLHLDDRSEETRVNQVIDLSTIINSSKVPTIAMGDLNAMHGDDFWPARILQNKLVKFMARFIFKSLSLRTTEMARGEALSLLQYSTNLIDADPRHQPTTTPKVRKYDFLPSIRLIQIDHIFASPNIKINNFQISKDGGADHRAISATISL